MLRLLIAALCCCGALGAQSFDFARKPLSRALFAADDQPAQPAGDSMFTYPAINERAAWRGVNLEVWSGVIAAKRSMVTLGLGLGFNLSGFMALVFRVDYNNDLGVAREFRPQVRQATFEAGVRLHIDLDENIAFYGNHGINLAGQLAYFKLNEATQGTDLGIVTSFGFGTADYFGLEFGNKHYRGFVETGVRTQFFVIQSADVEAAEGFEDDIRNAFRVQWVVLRAGFRYYF